MDHRRASQVYRVTTATTLTAIVFWKFFDVTKHGPLGDINPFANDPYDIVGSFAFQVALLVGVLNYARALRLKECPSATPRARLIVRGNLIVLGSIVTTLLGDVIALILHPMPHSFWAHVLWLALGLMSVLALACLGSMIVVLWGVHVPPPPPHLTPADGLDDLWTPVRIGAIKAGRVLPRRFVEWVTDFDSDKLFGAFPWVHPRQHPWRFACLLSVAAGLAIYLSKLREGPAPSLRIALLVAVIFVIAESVAVLLGFAILGAHLGFRPPVRRTWMLAKKA
jgi:hypothetical protein